MPIYETIAQCYDELFPLKPNRLSFVCSFLHQKKMAVLDIGCATGELALNLANQGHQVTGIDLDEQMIDRADEKKQPGLTIDFMVKDMTKTGIDFPPASFDTVLCLGNTLVHLQNLDNIKQFLLGIYKILKKNSVVLVQVVNYDRVLFEGLNPLPLLETGNFIFRREYDGHAPGACIRFLTHLTVKKTGGVITGSEILYPLTSRELTTVMSEAGFVKVKCWGNFDQIPYDQHSPALIVAAEKE